jgi:hypothetical protein
MKSCLSMTSVHQVQEAGQSTSRGYEGAAGVSYASAFPVTACAHYRPSAPCVGCCRAGYYLRSKTALSTRLTSTREFSCDQAVLHAQTHARVHASAKRSPSSHAAPPLPVPPQHDRAARCVAGRSSTGRCSTTTSSPAARTPSARPEPRPPSRAPAPSVWAGPGRHGALAGRGG